MVSSHWGEWAPLGTLPMGFLVLAPVTVLLVLASERTDGRPRLLILRTAALASGLGALTALEPALEYAYRFPVVSNPDALTWVEVSTQGMRWFLAYAGWALLLFALWPRVKSHVTAPALAVLLMALPAELALRIQYNRLHELAPEPRFANDAYGYFLTLLIVDAYLVGLTSLRGWRFWAVLIGAPVVVAIGSWVALMIALYQMGPFT